ncbi:hypothetical protein APHAL10511_003553 [Amanita phalloides]|nr:hypothetical protein APHAL10511_003553 [Amanita phalloides]
MPIDDSESSTQDMDNTQDPDTSLTLSLITTPEAGAFARIPDFVILHILGRELDLPTRPISQNEWRLNHSHSRTEFAPQAPKNEIIAKGNLGVQRYHLFKKYKRSLRTPRSFPRHNIADDLRI